MAEKKTNTITINDVEYTEDQLNVGKSAFVNMLTMSINAPAEVVEAAE